MAKQPMHANFKAFFNTALPGNEGGHVVVVGEDHRRSAHHKFTYEHFDEFVREHNLGTWATEAAPFLDVFAWALHDTKQDGNQRLPVKPEQTERYLQGIYQAWNHKYEGFAQNAGPAKRRAQAILQAVDRDIAIVNFDPRDTFDKMKNDLTPTMSVIRAYYAEFPNKRARLNADPEAVGKLAGELRKNYPNAESELNLKYNLNYMKGETIPYLNDQAVSMAYVMLEVIDVVQKDLKEKEGSTKLTYSKQVDNVDAVIEAGHKLHMSNDVIGAAILKHSMRPDKNTFAKSGLSHVGGGVFKSQAVEGTFARNLERMGVPTTPVAMFSTEEMRGNRLKEYCGWMYAGLQNGGIPKFDLPIIGVLDRGTLLNTRQLQGDYKQGSPEQQIMQARDAYDANPPGHSQLYDAQHIEKMQKAYESPEFQTALSQLHPR